MKNYIVGYLSFFENDLKLLKITADSQYEAIKNAMLELCGDEECRKSEVAWQDSEDYPETLEDLIDMLYNSDIAINVIEN